MSVVIESGPSPRARAKRAYRLRERNRLFELQRDIRNGKIQHELSDKLCAPERVARTYEEWFGGCDEEPTQLLKRCFEEMAGV
jgi:GTP cyclohydrolase I